MVWVLAQEFTPPVDGWLVLNVPPDFPYWYVRVTPGRAADYSSLDGVRDADLTLRALAAPVTAGTVYRIEYDDWDGPVTVPPAELWVSDVDLYVEDFSGGALPEGWTWRGADLTGYEAGVLADAPAGYTHSVGMRHTAPWVETSTATPILTGPQFAVPQLSILTFWARHWSANDDYTARQAGLTGDDPTGQNPNGVTVVNFYGEKWADQPYYTPPGWRQYQQPVGVGTMRFDMRDHHDSMGPPTDPPMEWRITGIQVTQYRAYSIPVLSYPTITGASGPSRRAFT